MKTTQCFLLALVTVAAYGCNPEETEHIKETTPTEAVVGSLELPRLAAGDQLVVHSTTLDGKPQITYSMGYNAELKHSRWVAFAWTDATAQKNWNRKNWTNGDPFAPDPSLPEGQRTELDDYYADNYDRGHICASADRLYSKEANEHTFYLSNMSPQLHSFNAGVWGNAENIVRSWAEDSSLRDTLFVAKGGTIAEGMYRVEPKHGKVVPEFYYMAVLRKKGDTYDAIGLWFEHKANSAKNLSPYVRSIDELEELTGIDFFYNLPDDVEQRVEAKVTGQWPGISAIEESDGALLYNSLMDNKMPEGFSIVTQKGSTQVWTATQQYGLKASAFINKKNLETESMLLMPSVEGATSLQMQMAVNFLEQARLTDHVDVLVSTNYAGGNANPADAEWTSVLAKQSKLPKGDSWSYTKLNIDLSSFGGKRLTVAVRYTSTTLTAPTLELKELIIK